MCAVQQRSPYEASCQSFEDAPGCAIGRVPAQKQGRTGKCCVKSHRKRCDGTHLDVLAEDAGHVIHTLAQQRHAVLLQVRHAEACQVRLEGDLHRGSQ